MSSGVRVKFFLCDASALAYQFEACRCLQALKFLEKKIKEWKEWDRYGLLSMQWTIIFCFLKRGSNRVFEVPPHVEMQYFKKG